jgi:hypothetical protein
MEELLIRLFFLQSCQVVSTQLRLFYQLKRLQPSLCVFMPSFHRTTQTCKGLPAATEAFILLPHEGLLPYFLIILASDLVSQPFPGIEELSV